MFLDWDSDFNNHKAHFGIVGKTLSMDYILDRNITNMKR